MMKSYSSLSVIASLAVLSNGALAQSDKNKNKDIDTIEVLGQSSSIELKSSGFQVDVIGTDNFQNASVDLNQILNTAPGINVRQTGGVGSNFDLSLNGLSGNQIRYFFDGIPMENFGSALTLNNFSANLAQNIEVYKGVVPISLSADALGGAINVTTPSLKEDILTPFSTLSTNDFL